MPWVPPALPVGDPLVTQDFDDLKKYLVGREAVDTLIGALVNQKLGFTGNANPLKCQVVPTASQAIAVGGGDFDLALPVAWPTAHLFFVGTMWPRTTWTGFQQTGVGLPINLTTGRIHYANSSTAQTFDFYGFSIGY